MIIILIQKTIFFMSLLFLIYIRILMYQSMALFLQINLRRSKAILLQDSLIYFINLICLIGLVYLKLILPSQLLFSMNLNLLLIMEKLMILFSIFITLIKFSINPKLFTLILKLSIFSNHWLKYFKFLELILNLIKKPFLN